VNTTADNGVFYGLLSESDCMAVCLASPGCIAVDLGPQGCVLHDNIDDLMTAYGMPGVTQFRLNRHCLPATRQPTTAAFTAGNYTEPTGIIISYVAIQSTEHVRLFEQACHLSHLSVCLPVWVNCGKRLIGSECRLV